ncbi:MAG: sugar ABC transporter ATP-binding protein [Clostridiales Family XIII bacterium]|jgi:ribose transport system ATP-binding protein|nr:sugar ABC transporter ATP-binding protein [Clostridiales Family XIII bacterium]
MTAAREPVLHIEKLCKSFGPTKANTDIDFELDRGEIRGLVGENGSGKSTLLSQIAGVIASDRGTMYLNGEIYAPQSPLDAYARKIGIVVQELGVIGTLSAGVNVFIGRTDAFTRAGIVDKKKMNAEIREIARKWGLADIPLNKPAKSLNVESRKQIELLRALAIDPQILILDEITQALSYDNRKRLHDLILTFKEMGRSVLIISHDLEEIAEITDTLTVLRDGRVVDTVRSDKVTMNDLKRMMVGREIEGDYYRTDAAPSREDRIVLSVRDLTVRKEVRSMSFDLHAGEILGFCGLSDSGIHMLGKALYGLEEDARGAVLLPEKGVRIKSSKMALENNIAYVPKERDGEGLMINAEIRDNFCLPSLDGMKGKFGLLSAKKLNDAANKAKDAFAVRCRDIFQEVGGLSGGNKQKINLGRWIAKDLSVLILDCPTRGVDVGVKSYIYRLMRDLKAKGLGIILISDELLEIIGMADRVFVVKYGEIAQELVRGTGFSEEAIIEVML